MPAAQPPTDWLNAPVPCRKATCTPCGAGGLPEVKPLLLPEMPAPPVKVQGEPLGRYWKPAVPHRHLLETRIGDEGRGRLHDGDGVDECGIVTAGAVQALEHDRMSPGGDGERDSGVAW